MELLKFYAHVCEMVPRSITLTVDCVDACLTNVREITELGRLLAAVVPLEFRRRTLNHHTTFSSQRGRRGADVNSSDNPVLSLRSCGLAKENCIRVHGDAWFVLLNLPHAFSNNDGIRVQVGGTGASKKAAIADAVLKTLHLLLTVLKRCISQQAFA